LETENIRVERTNSHRRCLVVKETQFLDLIYKKKLIKIHYLNDLDLTDKEYDEIKKHVFIIFKQLKALPVADRKKLLGKYMCLISIFLVWYYKRESNGSSYWQSVHAFSNSGVPLPNLTTLLASVFKDTVHYYKLIDFYDVFTHNVHLLPIQAHAFLPQYKQNVVYSIFTPLYAEYREQKDFNIVQNKLRALISLVKKQQVLENKQYKTDTIPDEMEFVRSQIELFNKKPFKDEFLDLLALAKEAPEILKVKIEQMRNYLSILPKIFDIKLIDLDPAWPNGIEKAHAKKPSIVEGVNKLFIKAAQIQKKMCESVQEKHKILPTLEIELKKIEAQYSGLMTKLVEYYEGQEYDEKLGKYGTFLEDKSRYNEIINNLISHEYLYDDHATIVEIRLALRKAENYLKGISNLSNMEAEGNTSFLQLIPLAMKQVCAFYPKIAEKQLQKEFNVFIHMQKESNKKSKLVKPEQQKKKVRNRLTHNNKQPTLIFDLADNSFKIRVKDYYFSNKDNSATSLLVKITVDNLLVEQVKRPIHVDSNSFYIESFTSQVNLMPQDFTVEVFDPSGKYLLKTFIWSINRPEIFIFNPDTGEEISAINEVCRINAIVHILVKTNGKTIYSHPLLNYKELEHRVINFRGCDEIILQRNRQELYKASLPVSHLKFELDPKGRINEMLLYKIDEISRIEIPVYCDIPNLYVFNNSGLPFLLECKRVENKTPEFIGVKIEPPIRFEDIHSDYHKVHVEDGGLKPGRYVYKISNKSTCNILAEFSFLYLPGLFCSWSKSLQFPSSGNTFNITNINEYKIFNSGQIFNNTHGIIHITSADSGDKILTVEHEDFSHTKVLTLQLPVIKWKLTRLTESSLNNKYWIEDILTNGNYLEIEKLYSGHENNSLSLVVNGQDEIPLEFSSGLEKINLYNWFNTLQDSQDDDELNISIVYQNEVLPLFSIWTKWVVYDVSFYSREESSSGVYIAWREKVSPKLKKIRVWKKSGNYSYEFIKEELVPFDKHDVYISIDSNQNSYGKYSFEFTCGNDNVWGLSIQEPDTSPYDYVFGAREAFLDKIQHEGIEIISVTKGLKTYNVKTRLFIKDICKAPTDAKFFEEDDQLLMGRAYYFKQGLQYLEDSSPVYFYINHERNTIPFIQDRDRDGAQFDCKISEIYWETRDYDNDPNRVIAPLDRLHIKKPTGDI